MNDVEYVKKILLQDYETERENEDPYPDLERVIEATGFDLSSGHVHGEMPSGAKSREGKPYMVFKYGGKRILSHRFIIAVGLGKWPPREFDVDHVNHDPSDNRPSNLRVVTRKDNAGNRRRALLSELVNIDDVAETIRERKKIRTEPKQAVGNQAVWWKIVPKDEVSPTRKVDPSPEVTYTGETKPAEYSNGIWKKTNIGSWHLHYDEAPKLKHRE